MWIRARPTDDDADAYMDCHRVIERDREIEKERFTAGHYVFYVCIMLFSAFKVCTFFQFSS